MLWELVRKDLRLFLADRRGMIVSIGVPIVLACFMAVIYGGVGGSSSGNSGGTKLNAVPIALVDEDDSPTSKEVVDDLKKAGMVDPRPMPADQAAAAVRTGRLGTALILPAGFGTRAGAALFGGADKPRVRILYDPSKSAEAQIVRGALMQSAMQIVSRDAFSVDAWPDVSRQSLERLESGNVPATERAALKELFASIDKFHRRPTSAPATATNPATQPATRAGLGTPFEVTDEPLAAAAQRTNPSGPSARRAGVVHAFVGMAVQGVLFFAIEAAMGLLRDRNRGIWRRFRAAPVPRAALLGGRAISGTILACVITAAVMLAGAALFRVRIEGSVVGFLFVCLATAVMASTFGLLVATLGRTEQQSRGFSILAVLLMVMLGGAWMPSFLMPKALAEAGKILPTRWAVDGLDAMTWRGLDLAHALGPTAALLGFSALFAAVAWTRFRWDAD